MDTQLTRCLLSYLIRKGYKYCLVATTSTSTEEHDVRIVLKPVRKHPLLQKLPKPYSRYYSLELEPVKMAMASSNANITVNLGIKEFERFNSLN